MRKGLRDRELLGKLTSEGVNYNIKVRKKGQLRGYFFLILTFLLILEVIDS